MATVKGDTTSLGELEIDDFGERLRGELIHPGDPNYEQARRVWNGLIDRRPALIARCANVEDVVECVRFARSHQILLSVRGGGHNVSGNAVNDGGLVIDLSRMRNVEVSESDRLARVQGGASWHGVDSETQAVGLATPGGLISATGVAGLTLGGGLGWLRRKWGLSCDNLRSAEVVTAEGEVITASATENADLFWGLRGGGGNLGVVTSFEFELHELGPMLMCAMVNYSAGRGRDALEFFREYAASAPDEVSLIASFWTIPSDPAFPEDTHGQQAILFATCYTGSVDDGEEVLQPLREFDKPLIDISSVLSYTRFQGIFDSDYPPGELYYWKSSYLNVLEDETIGAILDHCAQAPSPQSNVVVWHLGGAISRIAPEDTAYARRNAPYLLSIEGHWTDPRANEDNIRWARQFWTDMQPYAGGIYVNFAGLMEEQQLLARDIFGPNYDRMVELKNKYDPMNLFHMNANVEPTVT
ncbi:MAG: FAD-binding oxidoreductase [Chloroflexi bacterium]|nr:FAD-binding oxidoreductase [Chloroflexota bacterium]